MDFERACLRLPDSKTGAKVVHLGAAALELLAAQPRIQGTPFVFPGTIQGQALVGLPRIWRKIRERAGLSDVRIHDTRHGFASVGVTSGMGLPIVGALLGHTQAGTTQRYAHLSADPLKLAADRISGTIASPPPWMASPRPRWFPSRMRVDRSPKLPLPLSCLSV